MINTVNGIVVQEQNLGLYEGPIAVMVDPIKEPMLKWHGAPIRRYLWRSIVGFLRWSQKEFGCEAQLRLYYNETTSCWRAVVLPQWIIPGLSSDEIEDHDDRDALLAGVGFDRGWRPAGTVHHHCEAGAFMSSTDHKDEILQNGLHITLGHMGSDTMEIDARATFRKILYTVDLDEWIDTDELVTSSGGSFPEAWKARCRKKPPRVVITYPRQRQVGMQQWNGRAWVTKDNRAGFGGGTAAARQYPTQGRYTPPTPGARQVAPPPLSEAIARWQAGKSADVKRAASDLDDNADLQAMEDLLESNGLGSYCSTAVEALNMIDDLADLWFVAEDAARTLGLSELDVLELLAVVSESSAVQMDDIGAVSTLYRDVALRYDSGLRAFIPDDPDVDYGDDDGFTDITSSVEEERMMQEELAREEYEGLTHGGTLPLPSAEGAALSAAAEEIRRSARCI